MYTSTRKNLTISSKKCIEQGISTDGGLFVPLSLPKLELTKGDVNLSYQDLAKKIFKVFFDDFTDDELDEIINRAYNKDNFIAKIYGLKTIDSFSFLELYHGPTMAFKDMALTILPHLMSVSKRENKNSKKTLILTATSGDTGGAALSGFIKDNNTKVIVLYPTDGVSKFQENQMHYFNNKNCIAVAVEGNFDDCQNLVKEVFNENLKLKNYELSSANSINIGRLVPQVVYYFASYLNLVKNNQIKFGEKVNYVVPTGNFGNILACKYAKILGLPIDKIVCASNENRVLTDFFETGCYDKRREFKVTSSPAMDILISSNLERLLYLITNGNTNLVCSLMNDLKAKGYYQIDKKCRNNLSDFMAVSVNDKETKEFIKECYDNYSYLIDPHTAVAYGGYLKLKDKLSSSHTIIVSTASPLKFSDTMKEIFPCEKSIYDHLLKIGNLEEPASLKAILNAKYDKEIWTKENKKQKLIERIKKFDEED